MARLLEDHLPSNDPFEFFDTWYKEVFAIDSLTFEQKNAVCLSTVGKDMCPSSRIVLLNNFSSSGYNFFTHKTSTKGQQLEQNPKAAMLFYWSCLNRQIRIEGAVVELPEKEADQVWNSWPLASRISFKSSPQSTVVSREEMEKRREELAQKVKEDGEDAARRPERWIGYQLQPRFFEFWQEAEDRLHDRICFEKVHGEWKYYRRSP